jgi:transcriptional regulator with XRE-family HTH domain
MLRTLRHQAGLTQEQLADKSGVSLWTLRGYEIGRREPSWRSLLDLCKALAVDPRVFDPCVPGAEPPQAIHGRPPRASGDAEGPSPGPAATKRQRRKKR